MPPADPSLLVVVNPSASRAEAALPQIVDWFEDRARATLIVAHKKDELQRILEAEGRKVDRIVIGGGDGTLSKALPVLLDLKKPVATLPLGTANDFARTLGLPTDPLEAAKIAIEGREHKIDVGLANGKPYLNVASIGVASEVIKSQSKAMKQRWRVLAYAISLIRAVRDLQPFFVDLDIDDGPSWSAPVYQVSIGNGRHHGGGLTVAEDAAIDDGKLHLYAVYPGTFWQLVACLTHLRFGMMKPTLLDRHTATRVVLRTRRPRAVDTDGRHTTETPATFTLLPRSLTVIVPQALPEAHRGLSAISASA
ncbi:MAG TPA: lipid kinase [Methyloceanibacter sp.]|nr:lipid kinase [Methyloceanibacter sp.]